MVVLAGLVAAPPALAVPFELAWTATHPTPAVADLFAATVAVREGQVAVGVPYRDVGAATDAGAVLVLAAASGVVRAVLSAPVPAAGARLGSAVALSADVVLAGAPHEGSGRPHAGAVHRFALASGAHRGVLVNPEPGFDDLFGAAVAAPGAEVVAGAALDDAAGDAAGAAWMMRADGSARRTLTKPAPAPYDLFGAAVAASAAYVLVGAPADDAAQPNGGAVYVFDAVSGALLHTLLPVPPSRGDDFGRAVAVAGTLALVGAPRDDVELHPDAGSVQLFDLVTGARLRRCTAPAPEGGAAFGAAVAFRGTGLVVGAPFEDGGAVDAGAAYVLDAACGTLARLGNPVPHVDDQFGNAVAADGSVVAVGAWHDDPSGTAAQAGAVHLFVDLALPTTTTATTTPATTSTALGASTSTTPVTTTTTNGAGGPLASLPSESTTTSQATASSTLVVATSTIVAPTSTSVPQAGDACALDAAWDALDCRLEQLQVALRERGVAALGAARAARAGRQLRAARTQVARAGARQGTRARRPLRRAARALAVLRRTVERATPRGALPGWAVADLAAAARAAEAALVRLRP